MSYFDQIYQKLFAKDAPTSPVIHELIDRPSAYIEKYTVWLATERNSWIRDIHTSMELKKKGIVQRPEVHVLDSQYANGIAVSYFDSIGKEGFRFLLDYWKEQMTELGYRCVNYDRIIKDKGNFNEMIEKAYLKPPMGIQAPIDQRYGNVLIEAVWVNNQPSYLKLSASIYNDRQYLPALSFDTLLKQLLHTI